MMDFIYPDDSVAELVKAIKKKSVDYFILNLEKLVFFTPHDLTVLRCILDLAKQHEVECQIRFPVNTDACNYSERMGLYEGFRYNYPHIKHSSKKFFSLYKINSDRNEILFDKLNDLMGQMGASNFNYRLAEGLTELADNIYFHSGETYKAGWGYALAQTYPYERTIQLSLTDLGVGFYGSYSRENTIKERDEFQILEDSFNESESSLSARDKHRGVGLSEVKDFIFSPMSGPGELVIHSGNAILAMNKGKIARFKPSIGFPGTNIEMKVRIP